MYRAMAEFPDINKHDDAFLLTSIEERGWSEQHEETSNITTTISVLIKKLRLGSPEYDVNIHPGRSFNSNKMFASKLVNQRLSEARPNFAEASPRQISGRGHDTRKYIKTLETTPNRVYDTKKLNERNSERCKRVRFNFLAQSEPNSPQVLSRSDETRANVSIPDQLPKNNKMSNHHEDTATNSPLLRSALRCPKEDFDRKPLIRSNNSFEGFPPDYSIDYTHVDMSRRLKNMNRNLRSRRSMF